MKNHLNEKQVADRYGVSVKTVQNWRRTGVGPRYLKLQDRLVRYPEVFLEEYEKNNIQNSTSQNLAI
jgi:transposase